MVKQSSDTQIKKCHDTDLWKEIRTLYESSLKHKYEKIRTLLMTEFDLESFPSESTVNRRAKKEGWRRAVVESGINKNDGTFNDEFWLAVRSVYEAHVKLPYKRLKEYVQNELQCDQFPSQATVSAKAKKENWKYANSLATQDDRDLKKTLQAVNRLVGDFEQTVKKSNKNKEKDVNNEEHKADIYIDDGEVFFDFDAYGEQVEAEKKAIKNLLMDSQIRKRDLTEVIMKGRKRMTTINDSADAIADKLMLNQALLTSSDFMRMFGEAGIKQVTKELKSLAQVAAIFNELSFNRRESIKFELSLYGVSIEDLQNAGKENARIANINDDSDFEEQKARLELERERIAQRKHDIDSGALLARVQEEVQRRMAEADAEGDAEFDEIE